MQIRDWCKIYAIKHQAGDEKSEEMRVESEMEMQFSLVMKLLPVKMCKNRNYKY